MIETPDLRGLRESAQLTQQELAQRLGLSQSEISRLEQDPSAISLSVLARWQSVCTPEVRHPHGLTVPGESHQWLYGARTAINRYIDTWISPSEISNFDSIPKTREAKSVLASIIRKPIVTTFGLTDSGKSYTTNTLLGKDLIPVGLGPLTKALCIIVHKTDRPAWAMDDVYLFDENFEPTKWFDLDNVEYAKVRSGSIELLKAETTHRKFGFNQAIVKQSQTLFERATKGVSNLAAKLLPNRNFADQKSNRDINYAVIFDDSPLLEKVTFIDPPGMSEADDDQSLARIALSLADAVVMQTSVVGMGAKEKAGQDAMFLDAICATLTKTTGLAGVDLLKRILVVLTHFPKITEIELKTSVEFAKARIIGAFASFPRNDENYLLSSDDILRGLSTQFVALTQHEVGSYSGLYSKFQMLYREEFEKQWPHIVGKKVQNYASMISNNLDKQIEVISRELKNIGNAEIELEKMHRNAPQALEKWQRERDRLILISHKVQAEAENTLANLINHFSSEDGVLEYIERQYDDKEKEKAKETAFAYIIGELNRVCEREIKTKINELDEKVIAALSEFVKSIDIPEAEVHTRRFDIHSGWRAIVGGVGLIATYTTAVAVGVPLLVGGVFIFPPLILLVPMLGLVAFLGNWRAKLARGIAAEIKKGKIKSTMVGVCRQAFNNWRESFNMLIFGLKEKMDAYIERLEEVVAKRSSVGESERLQRILVELKETKEHFMRLPEVRE
jgi:transcriptional regulator with XRE-family HTH domain